MSDGTAWYYNVEERTAETGPPKRGFRETRLGPFATQAEAEGALDRLHARDRERDAADKAWRDGG